MTKRAYPALATGIQWLGLGAISFFVASNLLLVAVQIGLILAGSDAIDWHIYLAATERFGDGTLYERSEWWYAWRYSPIAVFPLLLLAPIGETAWRLLLGLSLVGLPGPARFLALASYPFWFAIHAGSFIVPIVVVAYLALRGHKWAIGVFLCLALLVPRPLMFPIAAWLLWTHRVWRWPFVGLFVLHAAAVMASGYADDWLAALVFTAPEEIAQAYNVAPSALIGLSWLLLAAPLAIWALAAKRPALSGLLLQPYWLPYYLLILLADALPARSWWLSRLTPFRPPAGAAEGAPPGAGPG